MSALEALQRVNPWSAIVRQRLHEVRSMADESAWLARRWDDPAFPANFPWFNSQRYWQDQILALREQQAALQEPPLRV